MLSVTTVDIVIPRRWAARFGPGAVYFERNVFLFLFYGFSAGLPRTLPSATLAFWLLKSGASLGEVGLFALVSLPWSLKFVWAPLMDRFQMPLLCRWLGRRRGWLLATQLALMVSLFALSGSTPAPGSLLPIAFLALLVAFFAASQDIVLDAYRVELLSERQQGGGIGAYMVGYRFGMIASMAGALMIASQFGWAAAYAAMAALVSVGIITVFLSPESQRAELVEAEKYNATAIAYLERKGIYQHWLRDMAAGFYTAVIAPFIDFMRRSGWPIILAFVLFYKFGDTLASSMTAGLYVDLAFSEDEIALAAKTVGISAALIGGLLGGMLVYARGIIPSLWICGILQLVSNFMFVLLANTGHDIWMLVATVSIENLAGGMGGAAFIAYMASLCNISFTATQYALLSSLTSVGGTLFSAPAGFLAQIVSWETFYLLTVLAGLPGLVLLWVLGKYYPTKESLPTSRR